MRRDVFLKYTDAEELIHVEHLIHFEISEGDIYVLSYISGNVSL